MKICLLSESKTIWLLGDEYLTEMHAELERHPGDYPILNGFAPITSRAWSGRRFQQIPFDLASLLEAEQCVPHAVLVHVGASDLCYYKLPKLRQRIRAMVMLLKEAMNRPDWDVSGFKGFFLSLVLPRNHWRFCYNQHAARTTRKQVNRALASVGRHCNMHIVAHENIKKSRLHLFIDDTNDPNWLSAEGVRIFTMAFEKALRPHFITPV